ncbi:MAG: HNH endonuclease [Synergistaceae bacterium]
MRPDPKPTKKKKRIVITDKKLIESLGNKPRRGKVFECSICGGSFYRKPSQCVPPPSYCSVRCRDIGQQNRVVLICDYCGTEYSRPKSHVKWNKIRGRKHHFCSISCSSLFWTPRGDKHPNWNGGISRAYQYGYHSAEYKNWHKRVFERDDYTCQACLKRGTYLHAHHIMGFSNYPDLRFSVSNGITLCKKCHMEVHSKQCDQSNPVISLLQKKAREDVKKKRAPSRIKNSLNYGEQLALKGQGTSVNTQNAL